MWKACPYYDILLYTYTVAANGIISSMHTIQTCTIIKKKGHINLLISLAQHTCRWDQKLVFVMCWNAFISRHFENGDDIHLYTAIYIWRMPNFISVLKDNVRYRQREIYASCLLMQSNRFTVYQSCLIRPLQLYHFQLRYYLLFIRSIITSRPQQNGCHFADDIFKCIFVKGHFIWFIYCD